MWNLVWELATCLYLFYECKSNLCQLQNNNKETTITDFTESGSDIVSCGIRIDVDLIANYNWTLDRLILTGRAN